MPSRQVPGSVPAAAERLASTICILQTRVANATFDLACLGNFLSVIHAKVAALKLLWSTCACAWSAESAGISREACSPADSDARCGCRRRGPFESLGMGCLGLLARRCLESACRSVFSCSCCHNCSYRSKRLLHTLQRRKLRDCTCSDRSRSNFRREFCLLLVSW